MSKFFGAIGYITQKEISPGIWDDMVVERSYRGDILQNYRKWDSTGDDTSGAVSQKNDNLVISNKVSIIADPFAYSNFSTIRYVIWMGVRWKVINIEIQRPRLILLLGSVYNG